MATSIPQITGFLDAAGLKYKIEQNFIRIGFRTHKYRDADGDLFISLVISPEEDGEFIKIIAPNVYKYPDGPHKMALFQLLLMISWKTKMIQYEYDVRDGEVRAIIEFPLEDATLTQKQFLRCLGAIAELVDDNHERVEAAMSRGELPKEEDDNMGALWAEFQAFLEQKRRSEGGGDHGLPA